MKNLHFILISILLHAFVLNSAIAQKKNAVKFNLLSPVAKSLSFSFERNISDKTSSQIGLSFVNIDVSGAKYTGFSLTPEQRIFTARWENMKVYFAPFIRYHNADLETLVLGENGQPATSNGDFTSFGGGIVVGGKFLYNDIAVLDIFLGPSYSRGKIDVTSGGEGHFTHFDIATGLFTGLSFRGGIAIGLAF